MSTSHHQRELLAAICERFHKGEGVAGRFFRMENTYLFIGEYKYWLMTHYERIDPYFDQDNYAINRAPLYRDRRDFVIQDGDTGRREDYPSEPARLAESEPKEETMSESDSLLAYLLPSYTSLLEDAATDALAFILSKSEACRMALDELLQDDEASMAPSVRFATQVSFSDGSRPDMVGYDDQGQKHLMVESKFWAGLQPDQAGRYLRLLDEPGVLMFICPASRVDALWPAVRSQLKHGEASHELENIETTEDICRAQVVGSKKCVILLSWNSLLARMQETEPDDSVQSDLRQLRGLTRRQNDGTLQIPEAGKDKPDFDARHAYYRSLIGAAVRQGIGKGWLVSNGLTWGNSPRLYSRRYVHVADALPVWLGLGVEYRTKLFDQTPLWVSVPNRFRPVGAKMPEDAVSTRDYWMLPMILKDSDAFEVVLNDLVDKFKNITDLFVAAKQTDGVEDKQ
ncbi:MAG: hypothetical protein F4066_06265 [Chloroflexi bacterium]|nr:hypothetical protein [Chloroflexota bacterium]MYF81531.1 hypothetical protein [Chloroflexota bacterium]MYI04450.1 hypothetical protein [Chloroflexota bacterium]